MTVNELIRRLSNLPVEQREMPVVIQIGDSFSDASDTLRIHREEVYYHAEDRVEAQICIETRY